MFWAGPQPARQPQPARRSQPISAGDRIATLRTGVYDITPQSTGVLNRDFSQMTPDGAAYGYTSGALMSGVIILSMPDATSLLIEHLPSATTDPATWNFTAARTRFVR